VTPRARWEARGVQALGFDPGLARSGTVGRDVTQVRQLFCRGAALLCAAIVLPSASATATTLFLSEFSSNGTPASDLTALMNFSVSALGDTLTLTVTNQTHTTTSGYNMNELYFSTSDDVFNLKLTGASGDDGDNLADWMLFSSLDTGNPTRSDGFGTFDWAVKDGVDSMPSTIHPMEVQIFDFSFKCRNGAECTDADFALELSTTTGQSEAVLGAAKFVAGPGGDSAFGGTTIIPEPAPAALLALGLAALAGRRRRAH
jgi:hypothetical protein